MAGVKGRSGRKPREVIVENQRPKRVPVTGNRDILHIEGKNPDYEYRFIKDTAETGARIYKFLAGGWEFAPQDGLLVGQNMVYKSEGLGSSIVRISAGRTGEYLYLMRIRKDWYEEDKRAKERMLKAEEQQIANPGTPEAAASDGNAGDGQYGGLSNDKGIAGKFSTELKNPASE